MKTLFTYFLLLVLISPVEAQNRQSLRRKDSFFGLHFDFHAVLTDKRIGESLTEGMLDSMLQAVKPDYVQVDSKGHPGISSYPTRVGTPAPDFTKDPLRLWRQVTARHGVALYVHHSGVYDKQAVQMHPAWAAVRAGGQRDSIYTSVHSPYVDQLLIPQLKELSSDYGVDGAWIDGEAWAMVPDYSEAALKKFRQETGIATVPRSRSDSGYVAFMEFNRRSFRQYVKHYADAIHAFNPQFQVASNWAFSSLMPDPVDAPVDFLSGDLSPTNSVNSAAFEARCLASQGRQFNKPWDLMSWGFTVNWDRMHVQSTKSVAQLSQEAAEIMAMGGGFECYFSQNRDASIKPWQVETMAGIARFTRARQPFCQGALPLPQIGLLYSSAGFRHVTPNVYRPWNQELQPLQGVLTALLDGQHPTEILMEHHLKGRMQDYPLLVVPEWAHLEPAFRDELLAYVSGGGNLLVMGADAVRPFEKALGVACQGEPTAVNQWLGWKGTLAGVNGRYQPVKLLPGARVIGGLYREQDTRYARGAAATVTSYGKGKIAGVYVNLGENYLNNQTYLHRDFLTALIKELLPRPVVSVEGSHLVHTAVNQLGKKRIIHLINTAGPHANNKIYTYDGIPPLGPLTVRIRTAGKPTRITREPAHQPVGFEYVNGQAVVKLPRLAIHEMLVVE